MEGFYPLVIILWQEGSRAGHGIMGHGIGNTLWANACMFPLSGQLDLGQILSHHGHGNGHIFGSIGIILVACSCVSKWSIYSDFRMNGTQLTRGKLPSSWMLWPMDLFILRVGSMDIVQTKFWL